MVEEKDLQEINGLIAARERINRKARKSAGDKSMLYFIKNTLTDLGVQPKDGYHYKRKTNSRRKIEWF